MNIDCKFVQDHLSELMDGELEVASIEGVRRHVVDCNSCARELVQFEKINQLARSVSSCAVQIPSWETIEQGLPFHKDNEKLCNYDSSKSMRFRSGSNLIAGPWRIMLGVAVSFAATVFLIVGVGKPWGANRSSPRSEAIPQATNASLNLQPLVEQFASDPRASIRTLNHRYKFEDLSLDDADASFGRSTYVSKSWKNQSLPGSASPESTKLLSLPSCQCPEGQCTCGEGGCNCIFSICKRPDGSVFLVFEQCDSQSIEFGSLPVVTGRRNGVEFQETRFDDVRAISFGWLSGKVVVVGLRDDSEVEALFADNLQ